MYPGSVVKDAANHVLVKRPAGGADVLGWTEGVLEAIFAPTAAAAVAAAAADQLA